MRISKLFFYISPVFLCLIFISQSYAKPHTHAGRAHAHPFPAQGVTHRHGNSAVGKSNKAIRKMSQKNKLSIKKEQKVITFWNGDIYIGDVKNGEPHGQGTAYKKNGATATGVFRNGVPYGLITFSYKDGTKRTEFYKNGEAVNIN